MRVLVLGRSGQLAQALLAKQPSGIEAVAWGRAELDLVDTGCIAAAICDFAPDAIINASAYTAVDRAETEADLAQALNVDAVAQMAEAARSLAVPFVHVSTDFVFGGDQPIAYTPEDSCAPLGVYGRTKREGEKVLLQTYPAAAIVRTAWVYRAGSANFMSTMLRLMAERDELGVVTDQIGTPTSADNLAEVLWRVVNRKLSGIWHYTDAGVASWYDFACAIYCEAIQAGVLAVQVAVKPIATADYPTPAKRPEFSVLDSRSLRAAIDWPAIHWQSALSEQIAKLKETP